MIRTQDRKIWKIKTKGKFGYEKLGSERMRGRQFPLIVEVQTVSKVMVRFIDNSTV